MVVCFCVCLQTIATHFVGTVYNLGMSVHALGPYHNIIRFSANVDGKSQGMFETAEIVASIPARWPLNPSYMHTFGK